MSFDVKKVIEEYNSITDEEERKNFIKKMKNEADNNSGYSLEEIEVGETVYNFVFEHNKLSCIMGPVGSGKTVGSVLKIFLYMQAIKKGKGGKRRSRWIVVRNTRVDLKATTIKTFLQWMRPYGTYYESKMLFKAKFNDVEAEVLFLALDNKKDVGKLLSLECTGIYFNELSKIEPVIYTTALQRIGRYPSKHADGAGAFFDMEKVEELGIIVDKSKNEINEFGEIEYQMSCIFADTNPPMMGSFYQKLFEKELVDEHGKDINPSDFKLYRQPSGLSPNAENIKNLEANYYEYIVRNSPSQAIIDTQVHVKYGIGETGLAVYGNFFNRDYHCAHGLYEKFYLNEMSKNCKLLVGMDFGLNPACVIGQFIENKLYLYDELYTKDDSKMGLEEFMKKKFLPLLEKKYYKFFKNRNNVLFCVDPAGNQNQQLTGTSLLREIRSYGFDVKYQDNNRIAPRLEAVKAFLTLNEGKSSIFFDTKMDWTIAGLAGNYYFKQSKNGLEDIPFKNEYSHIQDALQYLCKFLKEQRNRRFTEIDNFNPPVYNVMNNIADKKAGY
jgi:hypothetical protein